MSAQVTNEAGHYTVEAHQDQDRGSVVQVWLSDSIGWALARLGPDEADALAAALTATAAEVRRMREGKR